MRGNLPAIKRTEEKSMKSCIFLLVFLLMVASQQLHASPKQQRGQSKATFYGVVDTLPQKGFDGIWYISGKQVMVNPNTKIKEKHGVIKIGSYVKVEGFHEKHFTAHEIETKGIKKDKK
jgi:hypothetical protein